MNDGLAKRLVEEDSQSEGVLGPEHGDRASLLRDAGKKCVHHATMASRLPDIVASGGLLSSRRLGKPSDRWGANQKLGRRLVCCGFRVPWFLFKQFDGEESIVLSFDAATLSELPGAIFSPYNTARREATKYLEGEIDANTALAECLSGASAIHEPEFLAPEIPLSALRFVVFCDEEAKKAWVPVLEAERGRTVPDVLRVLVDGDLEQVRFPPDLAITERVRPLPPGVNHSGDDLSIEIPEPEVAPPDPGDIRSDFWALSKCPEPEEVLDSLIDWLQEQRPIREDKNRRVGPTRWIDAQTKVEERVSESGTRGLRDYVKEREGDDQLIPYRLQARRYLVRNGRRQDDLVALAAEYRKAANAPGRGPDRMSRDECLAKSLEIYRDALRVSNSSNDRRFALVGAAAVLADLGNVERAFQFCTVVLGEFPNDRKAQNLLARVETPWKAS